MDEDKAGRELTYYSAPHRAYTADDDDIEQLLQTLPDHKQAIRATFAVKDHANNRQYDLPPIVLITSRAWEMIADETLARLPLRDKKDKVLLIERGTWVLVYCPAAEDLGDYHIVRVVAVFHKSNKFDHEHIAVLCCWAKWKCEAGTTMEMLPTTELCWFGGLDVIDIYRRPEPQPAIESLEYIEVSHGRGKKTRGRRKETRSLFAEVRNDQIQHNLTKEIFDCDIDGVRVLAPYTQ